VVALVIVLVSVAVPASAQTANAPRCGTGVHESESTGSVAFPEDQIFCPLIADPKEPRSFVSYLYGTFRSLDDPTGEGTSIASVGIGDTFGLFRVGGPDPGEGIQLDVMGSIFAQFDLGTQSNDLINADYIVGFPLTFRRHGFSFRAKLYHQSSHLGDEYRFRSDEIIRENLSFESIEFLVSQELGVLRLYVGAEKIFRREPDTLPDSLFHTGVEVRSGRARKVQMLAGVDVKTTELHEWSPAWSGRVGLEFGRPGPEGHPGRLLMLLFEIYQGPSPYGQFFQDDISYLGAGFHIGL